jgi:predicted TIM-barrel fold metal-dependent hydrolase
MNRATFFSGAAALSAEATLFGAPARAQGGAFRVDVHHHLLPPFYAAAVAPRKPNGDVTGWTPEKSFADMEAAGVTTAILSMPRTPTVYYGGNDASRALARRVNEYMAGLRRTYPGRFRFWAELPLPDVEGSITEAAYALDTLGADGVAVATSYENKWLGDAAFAPLWAELDRRKAIVFTHPLSNQCCANQLAGVADTVVEYGTDTTRTIASIVFSGTAGRYPNMRLVFAHAGGTMPFLIERFRFQAKNPRSAALLPHGVDYELQRFYYDTAQASTVEAMGPLMKLIPTSHILFGTDFPYRKGAENVAGLAGCGIRSGDLQSIGRQNALALLDVKSTSSFLHGVGATL